MTTDQAYRQKRLKDDPEFRKYRRELHRLYMKRRYHSDPEMRRKHLARVKLGKAVRLGQVIKPTNCSLCGCEARLQAHHDDYDKPLVVIWMCLRCHESKHGGPGFSA